MSDPDVVIQLSGAEALVLFDLLWRFVQHETLAIEDQAEERALWNLQCRLERQLVEPFRPDYPELLAKARDQLRDREEP